MAKPSYVWGIDIGQCALKALRCRVEDGDLVADAFDYIEYPKILSQPEADAEQLVREALQQFLSRNQVRGCQVAMSVAGQSGLAKFFKPPPVDVQRIPEIVRYEARQQIPFPLEEVIWDFQKMAGGQEVDGFAIDAEVGLFAMKRDQVYRVLRPFEKQDVEIDIIQLAPLSIYNFVTHDLLTDLPDPDLYDADDPPESIVVLSMGTDATDLVVTNGFRVWQRSIPLGGNHFTKQLTKDMKLTFAKAEHLKRNARQAEDPKSVFQAMRPVFNDIVTEVQRSIGYFQGIDRKAKIRGVVLLGNTVKLPGLQQYISKNLGYEVINFDSFKRLSGPTVLSSPAFHDNRLAFGVCYGLCIQGLGKGQLGTNLLPPEISTQRMIRAKKPWAVASVGAIMLAFAFNFAFHYRVWSEVQPDRKTEGVSWNDAEGKVKNVQMMSSSFELKHNEKVAQLKFLEEIGEEVVGAGERRLLWLELLKVIDQALPWTPGIEPREYVDFKKLPYGQRHELYIEHIESQYFPDLASWYKRDVQEKHFELKRHLDARMPTTQVPQDATQTPGATAAADPTATGPSGPGWVIELKGYHYFNESPDAGKANHVRNTLLRNLDRGTVQLPIDKAGNMGSFTMREFGISYPILSFDEATTRPEQIPNPDYNAQPNLIDEAAPADEGENPPTFTVAKYNFEVQFCWQETLLSVRRQKRQERLEAEQAAAEAANTADGATQPVGGDQNEGS